MEREMVQAISLIKSSQYRYKILKTIGGEMLTPSEISRKVNIRLNHVSMVLQILKKSNLVRCLNEGTRKGRLYQLTELGKNAIQKFS